MATETLDAKSIMEQLLCDICYESHKHEVQTWKDAPGTDAERLGVVLVLARKALALHRGTLRPEDC